MTFSSSKQDLTGKNIIIVEDDLPSVKYYQTLLSNSGANIITFNNGKDFLDYMSGNNKADIILMDYLIPLVNGIECIRIIRKKKKKVPALIITAYYSDQAKKDAFVAGCNEYLLKPIYPEMIFMLLEKYLSKVRPASITF
jgi:CheY-like chemotaxis protein